MATIFRVDTPAELRRLDASYDTDRFAAWVWFVTVATVMLSIATVVAVVADFGPAAVAILAALLLATMVAEVRTVRTMRRMPPWRQPVRIGIPHIVQAHDLYWKLTPETRGSYALPLIETMYRLSVIDVHGQAAIDRIGDAIRDRYVALRHLVDAEDRLRMVAADPSLADGDDLAAAAAWEQAIGDVERQVTTSLDP